MPAYIRKVDARSWLTDNSLDVDKRIEKGVSHFRDPKPSVYIADEREDRAVAMAALAWERRNREIDRIGKTDFVIVTADQITQAGLTLVKTPSNVPWPVLQDHHYEITRDGDPCTDGDLRRLVRILIRDTAEHGRFRKGELQAIARKHCEEHAES